MASNICTYGDLKQGKTVASIMAGWDGVFVGPKESAVADPANHMVGVQVVFWQVRTIADVRAAAHEAKRRGFKKMIADDFSHVAMNTEVAYKEQFKGSSNRYAPWNSLRADFHGLLADCTSLDMDFLFTAHLTPPRVEKMGENGAIKKAMQGGPRLPLGMQEDLPGYMDLVLRTQLAEDSPRGKFKYGWPVVYRNGPYDTDYCTGDRNHVAPDCGNMNLAEILRAASPAIAERFKRPPQLHEFIEGAVEYYSKALVGADEMVQEKIYGELIARCLEQFKTLGEKTANISVMWALNDCSARAYLRVNSLRARPFALYTGLGNRVGVPIVGGGSGTTMAMDAPAVASTPEAPVTAPVKSANGMSL